MKIIDKTEDIRSEVRAFGRGSVALVPTMGSLHNGHGELIKAARRRSDKVIVSIFVNPTQFNDQIDLKEYPRTIEDDLELASKLGVDIVFAPEAEELYQKNNSSWVIIDGLADRLCGESRIGHFKGVTTVVAKLFNIIQPDIAFFGEKDWQQLQIVKKMVIDLDFPVEIVSIPTVRDPSGLATSSRNSLLSEEELRDAGVIWKSLLAARDGINSGNKDIDSIKMIVSDLLESAGSMDLEYISLCRPDDLSELISIEKPLLIALAVKVGNTRLIDNLLVS